MMKPDNTTPFDAPKYAHGIRAMMPHYDCFHGELIDLVQTMKPDVKVWLDTGCGDGSLIEKAYPHFPTTTFYAADPAESMLTETAARLANLPRGNLVIVGPFGTENLALKGARPDVITAVMSHHYLDREMRGQATERCFDLLAEGGIYITFENIRPDTAHGLENGLKRWERFQIAQGREPEVARAQSDRFDRSYFPITRDEHLSLLRGSGFRIAEPFWLSYLQGGFYAIK